MLNIFVLSFYDNFGLIFIGLKDMATKGIENRLLFTISLLIGVSSCENRSEYLHKRFITRNLIFANIYVSEKVEVPTFVFTYF